MDKHIKYSLIGGILLASLSLAYFLVVYTPQNNHEKVVAAQKDKCTDLGIKKTKEDDDKGLMAFNPEYKYDEKLDACLYQGGYISSGYHTKFIVDLFTNKEFASYTAPLDPNKWTETEKAKMSAYNDKAYELFPIR